MTKNRIKDNVCPNCLSRIVDENGIMMCTGNRLKMWETEFKRYDKMVTTEKKEFLISFSDSEKFIDFHKKWALVDENGNRPNFCCGYTNQIFSPIPDNRIVMSDPLQVKNVERQLKRSLTVEEINGNRDIVINGKVITLDRMFFPDDF